MYANAAADFSSSVCVLENTVAFALVVSHFE